MFEVKVGLVEVEDENVLVYCWEMWLLRKGKTTIKAQSYGSGLFDYVLSWFAWKLKPKIIGRMKSKVDPERDEFSMTVPRDRQIYGGMRDDLDVEGMEIGHDERHQHLKNSLWL